MSPRRRALIVLVAGLTLVGVGVAVLMTPQGVASFGWFAYAPLSEATFPPGLFLTPLHLWGAAAGVTGLVATSGALGYMVGRRDPTRRP